MVQALRETVTVGADGLIHLRATRLPVGTTAEVIVLLDVVKDDSAARLAILDRIVKELALDEKTANEWVKSVSEERKASSRP